MSRSRFALFAWGVLIYNLLVILWGAYVRATGSGAGCGSHWPLCDGKVIPTPKDVALLIEFSHRLSSGLVLLLVLGLVYWAFRAYPSGHIVRKGALYSLLFTLLEALLGAGLVLFELVAHNSSAERAVAMALHLANTFLLLGALALTAHWSSGASPIRLKGQGPIAWALGLGILAMIFVGMSGAVTALGDTLFPVKNTVEAIERGLAGDSHFLYRLRLFHPFIAIAVGLYLALVAGLVSHSRPGAQVRYWAGCIGTLYFVQIGHGFMNVWLKAPIYMQLSHLLLADLLWISMVMLSANALAEGAPRRDARETDGLRGAPSPLLGAGRVTWRDYVALTKPRVISLLLFTALAAMFIAKGGWPGLWLLLAVAAGGYMAAGAANAINMVIDRDIDVRMARTSKRPTVTQTISSQNALLFGLTLAVGSFLLLAGVANVLSAMMALSGLLFYVIIYTLALKRTTWHNIVIGGAAGAFPPLVGWAAVTNSLSPLAWVLFALIFFWTPVHFWALALLIKEDYAKAGIPMLPVVLGERVTVIQIACYAVLTVIISVLPLFQREVGWIYFVGAVLLNAALLLRSVQLYQRPERRQASVLFHYSMAYLALLFLIMAVDRAIKF